MSGKPHPYLPRIALPSWWRDQSILKPPQQCRLSTVHSLRQDAPSPRDRFVKQFWVMPHSLCRLPAPKSAQSSRLGAASCSLRALCGR
jgi:hypothetical protein